MSHNKLADIFKRIIPWLNETSTRTNYKGRRGRIGIIGGARDYAGAPYFAAISAMRIGADLAYVVCSKAASKSIKSYSPDLIVVPLLDCTNEDEFFSEMNCLLDRFHAMVVGPGLGRDDLIHTRVKKLIQIANQRSIPLVIDADGLLLLNRDPAMLKNYPNSIVTPNRIELQRLFNATSSSEFNLKSMTEDEIIDKIKLTSAKIGTVILAKGKNDIISDGIDFFEKTNDNHLGSNRRCGGQGDILSGLAAVYLNWIIQANENLAVQDKISQPAGWAAYLAAITTRRCNDMTFKEMGNGMLASDMIYKIHSALESLIISGTAKSEERGRSFSYHGVMTKDEISRYSRQMVMEEFGPERQMNLKKNSVLIIGAGGLGCPSAAYLGASGIGKLGIVDHDRVEISNLHRQILHNTHKVGMLKTESLKESVLAINPNVEIETHSIKLTRVNAVDLIENYDVIIDATDNLKTRYMINDACVVAKKPLVSGAALKMYGQLTVYNYDLETPCFSCLFPEAPHPNAVGSCTDDGVLGVIPGVIGVQQALEAIKIASGLRPAYAGKMLLFDGQTGLFRHITLSQRKSNCRACGTNSKLGRELIDYDEFCDLNVCKSQTISQNILDEGERVCVEEYLDILNSGKGHVLVDVRPSSHSELSRFEHAIPIPLLELIRNNEPSVHRIREALKSNNTNQIYVVCRLGKASQKATRIIKEAFKDSKPQVIVKDIEGGMTAWSKRIDSSYSCL